MTWSSGEGYFPYKDTQYCAWQLHPARQEIKSNSDPSLSNIRFLHKLICMWESKPSPSGYRLAISWTVHDRDAMCYKIH